MIKKVASLLLVFIWMVLIFNFSAQDGEKSAALSNEAITTVVERMTEIERETSEMDAIVDKLSFPLRKCAHFFVYFVLALLVMIALQTWEVKNRTLVITGIVCILFSMSDEMHQYFIDGRSGQVSDVLLDSSASLLASFLFHKYFILRRKHESISFEH